MEGNLPNDFIDDIRSRFDIVEIVSQYVQLKRSGRNHFGLCPFHGEKTPSFSVSQEKQIFHCFGCGEGGNVFTFLMKMEGYTFPEAVAELAKRAGIPLPETRTSPAARKVRRGRQRLAEMMELAARFYHSHLQQPGGRRAAAYLKQRGLTAETIKYFGLGYAPQAWDAVKAFLVRKGYTEGEMLSGGLLTDSERRSYDRFRNRIIFPICDQRGKVIAFGGRALGDGQPKYLNSPETPLFNKSKTLYALHLAREHIRQSKKAVIFEGYMDVIAAHQAGIGEAVASLGTALTETQARLLRNHTEEVIIVFDADTAGQAATWRGLAILRAAGCLVKVGVLPEGLDPDDFIRRFGGDAFRREILDRSQLLVDYQLSRLIARYNPENDSERIILFDKVAEVLAAVENAMEQEDYLQKAANLLKLPAQAIRREVDKVQKRRPVAAVARPLPERQPAGQKAEEKAPLQILALWARFPGLITETAATLQPEDIPPEFAAVFAAARQRAAAFSPALLLDLLTEEKYRQILSRLLINEEYDEKTARKAVTDCVNYLRCARIARRRKEIEIKLAKLDPGVARGEISELSREWLTLRKMEEEINQAREGGKGVGTEYGKRT
ncbi:MAG TPA: DNA primase [Firmicutes bacterium]|nr:DNA primase [Bacillota bacterium]